MAGAATSVIFVLTMKYVFVMTKPVFWRDKSMLVAKKLLIMFVTTKYFCHNKTFVVTNICRDNRVYCDNTFVSTSLFLSRQAYFCATNNVFVATKVTKAQFCHDKIIIIMYIYHALIKALSAHMIHMIFYTHVEHSPTKTIYIKYYIKK